MRRVMMLLLGALATVALLALWVRWMEPRMLYFPVRALEGTPADAGWTYEDVRLAAADGVRLHGWWIPAPADAARSPRLTVLFLHGNAGNISHRMEKLAILRGLGADVLILDYRGYGASEGRPGEAGLHRDALAAWHELAVRRGIDPRTIVLFGESLGTAVAAGLAAEVAAGGVVLEAAFTSVGDVARDLYPFLPLRWALRHRFDTLARIGAIAAPVLLLHSRDDELFPPRHAERLAAAAADATVVALRGGHNDAFLVSAEVYRRALDEFLARVAGAGVPTAWLLVALAAAGAAWFAGSGGAGRALLALRILDELRAPGPGSWLQRATPAPLAGPIALEHEGRGMAADLYRPPQGGGAVPLILVPGLVEAGKDDPRIAPFATLLARAGFTVVVPDLPSFRLLRVHPDNERELAFALDAVLARADLAPRGRAGLFGVSYAGGIAVLVALDPARAGRVAWVATVGAYADLDTALRFLATGRTFERGRMRQVKPDPYGRMVLVRTCAEFLADPRDRATLDAMVARRVRDPAAPLRDLADALGPDARRIHDLFETATPDEVPAMIEALPAGLRERIAALSPARRDFAPLRARLYLAHDRNDGTFPATESAALAARARPRPVRMVVLETVRHVDPQPWRRDPWGFLSRDLPEALRLAGWWYRLLGERGPGRDPVRTRGASAGPGAG